MYMIDIPASNIYWMENLKKDLLSFAENFERF